MTAVAPRQTPTATPTTSDPSAGESLAVVRDLLGLRRLIGLYPEGHPVIAERLAELDTGMQARLRDVPVVRVEVIRGDLHVDGVLARRHERTTALVVEELAECGVDSIHIERGVTADEVLAAAGFLERFRRARDGEAVEARLRSLGVTHVSFGRLVPLDTRWMTRQWPDAPTGVLDPAYEEALVLAQETFQQASSGRGLDATAVQDTVQLLIRRVARSSAAMGHIAAVKQYENLTYCHSVNVAMLSLLIGQQVGLSGPATVTLVEAALLHDIGKTRVPLDVVAKPGALDRHERRLIEAHAALGGEILASTEGLSALTPTVALEHHRTVTGRGYPDLGDGVIPHALSQIVSVADVYEALTGARSYKEPTPPERACAILARISGEQLQPALVKAFIGTISFFPIGSFVRTSSEEIGVVIRTNAANPVRPVIALLRHDGGAVADEIDLSDASRAGGRFIVETIPPPSGAPDLPSILGESSGRRDAL